ncbi:bifunctional enzyme IspD/IspF [Aureimonas sp. SA4125]|uniref:bifunctional 2-C-methyl-D-erythritol 4-phosphate cytidylyltransferase/2-C-methyl-D-erythritol 2,4-cyclodiphosphate synthase n=1 Tax=Aureimonas sp. SA4125 TaxID=2826993 RepID=UPI001CC40C74|nr:bifunctional 2-C-methyl-D-erythritol 4-phosphate cytidylyltransferase/2-C-methyl-D-erythritol 2,4-cyclodiphosphate synthase [Aureimonas sp. SA4125]BDA84668.1 bifunctional enzyme IspD/IspF [Aureimonas sp. SA4125]
MPNSKVAVIIVAAGRGARAGQAAGPKQYREIGGRTVLARSIDAFATTADLGDRLVVVIHPDDRDRFELATASSRQPVRSVDGGATRQDSVRRGLEALTDLEPDIVLIHDAARPFVDAGTIARVVAGVGNAWGAIPAMAVSDTLKRAGDAGDITETVDRAGLYAAQTPQGFPYAAVLAAHRAAAEAGLDAFTDDAAIAEWAGMAVRLVEGSPENLKLTRNEDIIRADRILRGEAELIDVRTGNGYDVHQLVDGDHVTLCGVRITHDQTLLGHSDADVCLHALTDALLATCGAGDIGTHFPPSEEEWRGAASHIFVRRAVEIVREHGGRIANADITLICEAPKVAPHREAMRRAVAEMTGLDLFRVSVKATTNETIGFVGRREGIAALATASVIYGEGR